MIGSFMKIKHFLFKYFLFICWALFSFPIATNAAILYLIPQWQTVYSEDDFVVQVHVDSENQEINVVQAKLMFPQELLEATETGEGNSILTLWTEKSTFSNKTGIVQFQGGVPGGFSGKGELGKIFFKAKKAGIAKISFSPESRVLLNDGKGTLAESSFLEANYQIVERPERLPVLSSRSHPDQNEWYKNRTLHIHWDLLEGVRYSYILSLDPLAEPDEIPDRPEGELMWLGDMEYENLEDGIYYFSLRQQPPSEDWSSKVTFRVMIDATLPSPFELEIGKDPTLFEGRYFLSFAATDKTSGLDHYEISETKRGREDVWKIGTSPYLLEDQSLESIIRVRALDKAGNEQVAEFFPPEKPPFFQMAILIVVGVVGFLWWIVRLIKAIKKKRGVETKDRDDS